MKTSAILLTTFGLLSGFLQAQTVPLFINYQGTVTDGNGKPLGSTGTAPNFTAAPVNRKVIFRLYGSQNGNDRQWSEQQTVTISLGQFSVLLGQGTPAVYNSVTESPRPALDAVFTSGGPVIPSGPARFLEIVVDDGSGTFDAADLAIAPRQRITSTAYSFRASVADSVPASAIPANAISENAVASNAITTLKISDAAVTSAKIADGTVANVDIADNAINSAKILDGTVVNADIAANAAIVDTKLATISTAGKVADTALSPNVATLNRSPQTFTGATNSFTNRVGIGTTTPVAGLHVNSSGFPTAFIDGSSTAGTWLGLRNTSAGGTNWHLISTGSGNGEGTGKLLFNAGTAPSASATNVMTLLPSGRVGIGTTTPNAPLHVATSASQTLARLEAYYGISGYNDYASPGFANYTESFSIEALDGIKARFLAVPSDERIKDIVGQSKSAEDLDTLLDIEVTDYRYKDKLTSGSKVIKKVIAQQVEKVFPAAIGHSTGVIPDIYQPAEVKDGWIQMESDLKVGERVRLISKAGDEVVAVTETREGGFRTASNPSGEKLFVYGREVDDFRTVDYEAISMLNVSATQQIKKEKDAEVNALREENSGLRSRIAELEAKDAARDATISAIEKRLESMDRGSVRTVSLNTGELAR